MKEQLKGVEKMKYSSLNIHRNIENQERSSYLSLDNEKIRLKIVGDC